MRVLLRGHASRTVNRHISFFVVVVVVFSGRQKGLTAGPLQGSEGCFIVAGEGLSAEADEKRSAAHFRFFHNPLLLMF